MANLASLKDDTFEQDVLQATEPVLVDFSATWCGPCKALAPTLEALASEYDGKVKFYNVDVDEARATAMRYGVQSVPTIMMFKNGQVVGQLLGNRPKSDLTQLIDQAMER